MRTHYEQPVSENWSKGLLLWLAEKDFSFCFKGKGWGSFSQSNYEVFAGFGVKQQIQGFESEKKLSDFVNLTKDYIISHITYDVKNHLENLSSKNIDRVSFPEIQFTVPKVAFKLVGNNLFASYFETDFTEQEIRRIISEIETRKNSEIKKTTLSKPNWRLTKAQYIEALTALKAHIKQGNIYQANYCQEVFWPRSQVNTGAIFHQGFEENPNPFSVYYKTEKHHCMSFSPERFLAIDNNTVYSQPMKGTAPRGHSETEDKTQIEILKNSEKDRRENVMIVDMVRNDLSHFAAKGSVKVPELYRVQTYPKVHQMYSTVKAELNHPENLMKAILKCFPMGSMTGAPKISAMKIIEELEYSKRGLFSGTIGFITPEKNADFNVIIRSLIYDEESKYLSCHVGGGITDMSDIEAEYEECLVKVRPILQLLSNADSNSN